MGEDSDGLLGDAGVAHLVLGGSESVLDHGVSLVASLSDVRPCAPRPGLKEHSPGSSPQGLLPLSPKRLPYLLSASSTHSSGGQHVSPLLPRRPPSVRRRASGDSASTRSHGAQDRLDRTTRGQARPVPSAGDGARFPIAPRVGFGRIIEDGRAGYCDGGR